MSENREYKKDGMKMLIAVVFLIAKSWKEFKCLRIGK